MFVDGGFFFPSEKDFHLLWQDDESTFCVLFSYSSLERHYTALFVISASNDIKNNAKA
jgi:hypothetical protein